MLRKSPKESSNSHNPEVISPEDNLINQLKEFDWPLSPKLKDNLIEALKNKKIHDSIELFKADKLHSEQLMDAHEALKKYIVELRKLHLKLTVQFNEPSDLDEVKKLRSNNTRKYLNLLNDFMHYFDTLSGISRKMAEQVTRDRVANAGKSQVQTSGKSLSDELAEVMETPSRMNDKEEDIVTKKSAANSDFYERAEKMVEADAQGAARRNAQESYENDNRKARILDKNCKDLLQIQASLKARADELRNENKKWKPEFIFHKQRKINQLNILSIELGGVAIKKVKDNELLLESKVFKQTLNNARNSSLTAGLFWHRTRNLIDNIIDGNLDRNTQPPVKSKK